MITSIQLHDKVKTALDKLKEKNSETYEEVIAKMISLFDKQKRKNRELLIEGCKEMAQESLNITKEFEVADSEIEWEWNEN